MFTVFISAFVSIFLAEFGDKTQLISLNLASRFPPWQVLAGAMTGLSLVLAIAVGAGGIIYTYIPITAIIIFSGAFFIFIGIWIYFVPEKNDRPEEGRRSGFFQAAVLTFISELGDKTQIAAMLLAASFGMPLVVLAGAMLAMFVNHSIAVFLGARFLKRIPEKMLRRISSLVFILIGILILAFGAGDQSIN